MKSLKLMVVDDSMVIREKIAAVLSRHEYALDIVASASNGLEAIEMFDVHCPDVVTLDITMPIMDGIETIETMLRINPDAKILVVSALADKTTLIKAMHLGASGFLCKPFNDAELDEAIIDLLEDLF